MTTTKNRRRRRQRDKEKTIPPNSYIDDKEQEEESFDDASNSRMVVSSSEQHTSVDLAVIDTGKSDETSWNNQTNEPMVAAQDAPFVDPLSFETFEDSPPATVPEQNLWDRVKDLVGDENDEPFLMNDDSMHVVVEAVVQAASRASADEASGGSAEEEPADDESIVVEDDGAGSSATPPSDDIVMSDAARTTVDSCPMMEDVDYELASQPILKTLTDDDEIITMEEDSIMQHDDDESFGDSSDDDDDYELVVSRAQHDRRGIDIRTLASILESAKEATSDIDSNSDVVLVLGGTGAGKSTFIQAIAGHSFRMGWDQSLHRDCYVVDGEGEQGFEIGEGMRSRTRHVRSFLRDGTFYVDSSGFGDTEGIETDIATSICVKDIASRCRRMRFVVLINAYSFFHNRGTELRKSLDLVANFVGDNFNTHKQSFTFLFTHCNKAFDSVPSRMETDCSAEAATKILAAMREELKALLKSLKSETPDLKQMKLADFLYISLKKGYPYCDVFDPILSEVLKIVEGVEPATSKTCISEPARHVKCSLTNDAKTFLSHELSKRQEAVLHRIGEDLYDEDLAEDVRALFTLKYHIGDICQGPSNAVQEAMMRSSVQIQDRIFSIADRGLLSDGSSIFTLEDANSLKAAIENLAFVESLSSDAETRTTATLRNELVRLVEDQHVIIQAEMSKVTCHEIPSINIVVAKLTSFRNFAQAFESDAIKMYKETAAHVRAVLDGIGNALKSEEPLCTLHALLSYIVLNRSFDLGLVDIIASDTPEAFAVLGDSLEQSKSLTLILLTEMKHKIECSAVAFFTGSRQIKGKGNDAIPRLQEVLN